MIFADPDQINSLLRPLAMDIYRGAHAAKVISAQNQARIGRENQLKDHRMVDGFGEQFAEIDQDTFVRAQMKYGYDCWHDPEFMAHTLRHNPEMRVKAKKKTFIVRP